MRRLLVLILVVAASACGRSPSTGGDSGAIEAAAWLLPEVDGFGGAALPPQAVRTAAAKKAQSVAMRGRNTLAAGR